jgi:FMN phosphatase YigB (HAD superfamily)
MELYGFSGQLGVGKNFIAEKLFLNMLPKKNTIVMALADQIKVDCCTKDNIDFDLVFHHKDEVTRKHLQKRGTEEGRLIYGEDFWIRYLENWIKVYTERGIERVIITDLRFPNEVEWLKSKGGFTFRVVANKRNHDQLLRESNNDPVKMDAIKNHKSEIALDDYNKFDYIINNDYDDRLNVANQVRDIVRELIYKKPVRLTIFCDLDDTICVCAKFYAEIIESVKTLVKNNTNLEDSVITEIITKHVYSFEHRYYTYDDFAKSLVNFAVEAYLVKGMSMSLKEDFLQKIYKLGLDVYNRNYEPLYEDSLQRIQELRKRGQLVIFTLGDHVEQQKKIVHLALFDIPVEIFTHKDVNMFRYLQSKYPSDDYIMIGDSINRDILPSKESGIKHLVHIQRKVSAMPLASHAMKELVGILSIDRLNDTLMNYIDDIVSN